MIVGSFLPIFFVKNYADYKTEYSVLNAGALSICGFLAAILGGIAENILENKSYMSKAWICCLGSILSFPLIAIGTL
jgi:uncharacterized membrane protein YadS